MLRCHLYAKIFVIVTLSRSYLEDRRKQLASKKNYSQLSKTQSYITDMKKELKLG